ncbi:MAG: DUF2254 domain-containing protein [Pirellulaceae bacterium]
MSMQFDAIRDRIRSAVWILPAALLLLAVAAGVLLPLVDRFVGDSVSKVEMLTTTPDGAQTILATIASSAVTVAGVVFSLTMVMFSIASSQFGTRVLRNRMRERSTQVAVGTLLGTAVYCLLVLRSVSGVQGESHVPHLSVMTAILLTLVSLLVVVFFLRDMTNAIQATHIVASIAGELDASIDRLFPEKIGYGNAAEEDDDCWRPDSASRPVASSQQGYIQAIDGDELLSVAQRRDLVIFLRKRPGDFLARRMEFAEVWGANEVDDELAAAINEAIVTGITRTPWQDVNCSIHELAQVAVRALSPGINDPFTAMNSIDRLGAALMKLAERKTPSRFRRDAAGRLRLVANPVTFAEALAAAFNQVRMYAINSPAVSTRLLEALENIAGCVHREADREAIISQARLLAEACDIALSLASEQAQIRGQMQRVVKAFPDAAADDDPAGVGDEGPTNGDAPDETDQPEDAGVGKGEVNG